MPFTFYCKLLIQCQVNSGICILQHQQQQVINCCLLVSGTGTTPVELITCSPVIEINKHRWTNWKIWYLESIFTTCLLRTQCLVCFYLRAKCSSRLHSMKNINMSICFNNKCESIICKKKMNNNKDCVSYLSVKTLFLFHEIKQPLNLEGRRCHGSNAVFHSLPTKQPRHYTSYFPATNLSHAQTDEHKVKHKPDHIQILAVSIYSSLPASLCFFMFPVALLFLFLQIKFQAVRLEWRNRNLVYVILNQTSRSRSQCPVGNAATTTKAMHYLKLLQLMLNNSLIEMTESKSEMNYDQLL